MAARLEWLRNFFAVNRALKALALLLAILSFYAIRSATRSMVSLPVSVRILADAGIAMLDPPGTLDVTFRGSQEDLNRLNVKEMNAVVRVRASSPSGSEEIGVDPGDIQGVPVGVRVVKIEPETVFLNFDREIVKEFPVAKPRVIGAPLIGRVELDYKPRMVKVRGPQRRLENTRIVETAPVTVTDRASSFSVRVPVLAPGDSAVTEITPPEIAVEVKIVTESVTRVLTNIAVVAMIGPAVVERIDFDPVSVAVSLHGRAELVNSIGENDVRTFVDCVGLAAESEYSMPVRIYLPADTDVNASVEPRNVKVTIGRRTP